MDRDLGTEYGPRFLEFLKTVQKKDLSVAGALTEPRGSRSKKMVDWPDPYLALKVVEKNDKGIVVRGAKINISGAYASHELLVLPQGAHSEAEADYAVAFATPPTPRVSPMSASIPLIRRSVIWPTTWKNWAIRSLGGAKPPW